MSSVHLINWHILFEHTLPLANNGFYIFYKGIAFCPKRCQIMVKYRYTIKSHCIETQALPPVNLEIWQCLYKAGPICFTMDTVLRPKNDIQNSIKHRSFLWFHWPVVHTKWYQNTGRESLLKTILLAALSAKMDPDIDRYTNPSRRFVEGSRFLLRSVLKQRISGWKIFTGKGRNSLFQNNF